MTQYITRVIADKSDCSLTMVYRTRRRDGSEATVVEKTLFPDRDTWRAEIRLRAALLMESIGEPS